MICKGTPCPDVAPVFLVLAVLLVLVSLPVFLAACGGGATSASVDAVIADVGFATPESVVHDAVADVYLVSNIGGDPVGKDRDGFISRLSPDGEVLALRWIDGAAQGVELHAPKGMVILGDALLVADIDTVRTFHRVSGAPLAERRIDGATFLNDLAIGPDGGIYVSDTGVGAGFEPAGTGAIYRLDADLTPERVASGAALGQPNGLAAGKSDLFFVNWQRGEFALLLPSGEPGGVLKLPHGKLDGLVRTAAGSFLASSWEGRAVYAIAPNGSVTVRFGDLESPADIGYDARRNRLLIPLFTQDRVLLRKL